MSDAAGALVLVGRILFALFFGVVAGVGSHIRQSKGMEGYSRAMRFPIPAIAGWPTGLWLVVGSVFIGFGIWGDIGALMIAAFVLTAAAWFHRFWELPEDDPQKMMQTGFLFRNVIALAMTIVLFALFAEFGSDLPFTITDSVFDL